MISLDVSGCGASWVIVDRATGAHVGQPYGSRSAAETHAHTLESTSHHRQRPCLCCTATFTSTGVGHRLCDPCRAEARLSIV